MSNKELGQAARAALKEAGYNLKDISVTAKYAGYEQVLNVRIKSADINADEVSKIAKQFRQVDYDEVAQEVLAGANTFVSVVDMNGYTH